MGHKPPNIQSLIPALTFKDARAAIALYQTVFGAELLDVIEAKDGSIFHGGLCIEDSVLFFHDQSDMPPRKAPSAPQSISLFLYVRDVDAVYAKACAAGMKSLKPPTHMQFDDKIAVVQDPFYYKWTLATDLKTYD